MINAAHRYPIVKGMLVVLSILIFVVEHVPVLLINFVQGGPVNVLLVKLITKEHALHHHVLLCITVVTTLLMV